MSDERLRALERRAKDDPEAARLLAIVRAAPRERPHAARLLPLARLVRLVLRYRVVRVSVSPVETGRRKRK